MAFIEIPTKIWVHALVVASVALASASSAQEPISVQRMASLLDQWEADSERAVLTRGTAEAAIELVPELPKEARVLRQRFGALVLRSVDSGLRQQAVAVRLLADGRGLEYRSDLIPWLREMSRDRASLIALSLEVDSASAETRSQLVEFASEELRVTERIDQIAWIRVLRAGGPEGIAAALAAAEEGFLTKRAYAAAHGRGSGL